MSDAFEPWFASAFDKARRTRLESFGSFADVIAKVVLAIRRVEARHKPGTDLGLTECWRPEFVLFVDENSFDGFFNSQCGYRAQYARDADLGLAANGRIIRELAGILLGAAALDAELSQLPVELSLEAASAKIWPQEDDLAFTHFTRDLAVPRWVRAADGGSEKARMGLVAPQASTLEVKGAFLDKFPNEVVQTSKIRRRQQLHELGFS